MALKLCANPECNNWFQPKSDSAKCCGIKCKNRKNYLIDTLEYSWEEDCITSRRKNSKILEYLLSLKRVISDRTTLELMGFNFSVCFAPLEDEIKNHFYRFGNCFLKQVAENEFEISYTND